MINHMVGSHGQERLLDNMHYMALVTSLHAFKNLNYVKINL